MKNKKIIYSVISILVIVLIVFGIKGIKSDNFTPNSGNKTGETQSISKKIIMKEFQKYDDSSEYTGTREYIFDLKNNLIYAKIKNKIGEVEFYYKIRGKKVDMYSKNIGDKEFILEKNIDIANSPVQGILDRFNIQNSEEFVELDNQKESEKYKTLINKKLMNNTSKVSLSKMSEEDRNKLLEDFKKPVDNYEKFAKENRDITILIDKKTNRVVKVTENITENSLLNYYMAGGSESGEKMPTETRVESNYYYDDIKKISIPQNVKEN
ncbi:MAG: hypothetical protein RR561_00505 [Peptostreptococcus sp.]|uniref:hypothetical protein n=1 Tax=Peptostreptococcus sp. TaxID=1262 RepID=UPI002FC6C55C